MNRFYRQTIDAILAQRHSLVDYLFSLPPLDSPGRLERIFSLANDYTVEVETHPVRPDEYRFLMSEQFHRITDDIRMALPSEQSRGRASKLG